MTTYPAISLWQPYASLIFVPFGIGKAHETRSRRPPAKVIGTHVVIHAAKAEPKVDAAVDALCSMFFGTAWRETLPRGCLIGAVRLRDIHPMDSSKPFGGAAHAIDYLTGDWTPGRWAYELAAAVPFFTPIPAKGQQGWWSVDIENTMSAAPRKPRTKA